MKIYKPKFWDFAYDKRLDSINEIVRRVVDENVKSALRDYIRHGKISVKVTKKGQIQATFWCADSELSCRRKINLLKFEIDTLTAGPQNEELTR